MKLGRLALAIMLALGAVHAAAAQSFPLSRADIADSARLAATVRRLATQVLATYRDDDRVRYLDNRYRLEILAGNYAGASKSLADLRAGDKDNRPAARALRVPNEIFAAAMREAREASRPFPAAFAAAFRRRFAGLDDAAAAFAARAMLVPRRTLENQLGVAMPALGNASSVSLGDALRMLRAYQATDSYRRFAELVRPLVAEDEVRRYIVETKVAVRTPDEGTVCAIVVRPRAAPAKRPALLQFTIYADSITSRNDALLAAAHGYAGVTGFTRGKACSPDKTIPYLQDGADAAALIDWIASQPWSDGRVGMYGGSYSGFTPWAAAKLMPKALKGIMVGAPVAPGIDVPMEGNIFANFVYPWPFYTTNNRWLDTATYNLNGRWNQLYETWYSTGRAYRELEKIDGTPNPVFAEWIAHPVVDAYWRKLMPEGAEYARITIPVLQTAGYFFGGPGGAVWYLREHYKYNPRAEHYLVIGPWDHPQAQRGVVSARSDTAINIAGYEIDRVARVDLVASLRYQWFDYVLRGAPKPSLLGDRINYQVLGANVWKHAPNIGAMSTSRLRFYLNASTSRGGYSLSERPSAKAVIQQTVNLADRSDANRGLVGGIVADVIDTANGIMLVSEPLKTATEVSGLLSGHLELIANKRDFDFSITVYELMPNGQYFQLPPYMSRASHVGSPYERRLLEPGKRERLDFETHLRMVSRRLSAGSRLVMVLSVVKGPGQQVNYGTGRDVSDESLADAKEPLRVQWLGDSYIELPVRP